MKDICQPSLDILREKCTSWLRDNAVRGPLLFPDLGDSIFEEQGTEVINVIFFGSFLKRFLETGNWPSSRYRFWVLCEAARDVFIELFGVPRDRIGVIPRYELFAPALKPKPFPALGESFTLVYSGRISPTKNIEMLLKTVSFLQTRQGIPVDLVLFGRFDNELHIDREPPPEEERFTDYRARILQTIEESEWKRPPRLIEDRGPDEWYRAKLKRPVLLSLSTFLSEDFGVSVAQAQALGWPCLLSDWGAYRDVKGPGVRRIPASLIAAHETRQLIGLRAEQLASHIRRMLKSPAKEEPIHRKPSRADRRPAITGTAELDLFRRQLVTKLGSSAPLICRDEIHRVNGTPKGAIFFSKYRQLFSGKPPSPECVLIVNNFNKSRNPLFSHVSRAASLLAREALLRDVELTFVFATDIYHLDVLVLLLNAKKVVMPFFTEELLPAALFLRRTLPSNVPFTVYSKKVRRALTKLKGALSPGDRLRELDGTAALGQWVRSEFGREATSQKRSTAKTPSSYP